MKSIHRSLLLIAALAAVTFLFGSAAPAEAQFGPSCGAVIPHCATCEGSPYLHCTRCETGYGFNDRGQCVQCSEVATPNCAICRGRECTTCDKGYELSDGSCTPCTQIDPNCKSCSGGACTSCAGGYGVADGGSSCQQCSTIEPKCTACSNGVCTACQSGYGVPAGGGSCEPCTNLDPNCTTCNDGKCNSCTNGLAANLAGECVQPGTSSCSYDLGGQCCKCQYSCEGYNPAGGGCVGAPSNACGNQCDPYSRQ